MSEADIEKLSEFVRQLEMMQDQLKWAKSHISKVVKENRAFTPKEVECLRLDHLIEE